MQSYQDIRSSYLNDAIESYQPEDRSRFPITLAELFDDFPSYRFNFIRNTINIINLNLEISSHNGHGRAMLYFINSVEIGLIMSSSPDSHAITTISPPETEPETTFGIQELALEILGSLAPSLGQTSRACPREAIS
ncbi:hypothetical protein ACI5KX_10635 [Erythrobacter sp. GH1-10]|uniref:hypothetical protein n=1 Tax=Erythrobacter sp. GH1-10 TaxID=3349334 RepID=UPI003878224E